MSINPTLKNEQLAAYLATDDSVRALEKAVDNGQTRLALQVVLDLISELTERVMDLEDIVHSSEEELDGQDAPSEVVVANDTPVEQQVPVNTDKSEAKKDEAVTEKVEQNKVKSEETKVSK